MTIKDKIETVMDKVTHKKPPHQSHTAAKTSNLTGSTTGNYATGAGGNDMTGAGARDSYSLGHTGTTTPAASDYRHRVDDRPSTAYDSTATGGGLTAGSGGGGGLTAGSGLTGKSYTSSSSEGAGYGTSGLGAGATEAALGAGSMGAGSAHSGQTGHLSPGPVEQTPGTPNTAELRESHMGSGMGATGGGAGLTSGAGMTGGGREYSSSGTSGYTTGMTGAGMGGTAAGLSGGRTEYDTGSTYGTTGNTTGAYGTTELIGGTTTDRSYGTTTGVTGADTTYGTTTGVTSGARTGGIDEREIIDSKTFTKTIDHEVLIEKKQYELEHRPVQEQYVVETRRVGETAMPTRAEYVGNEVREVDEKIVAAPRGERTVIVQDVDVPLEEVREVTRGVGNVGLTDKSYTSGPVGGTYSARTVEE